ncbi:site-specific DNA-methyltransferase (adenine-specific) [Planctomycetales bacterium]|nr:site-specific DNA-methyltransferase (adenine-specific) [Planctomycetales bacterium]
MNKILVPPIKCQGIKTKLVPLILANAGNIPNGRWIEPFMGSCVVGLNARCPQALFSDQNPHLVNFYQALQDGTITANIAREFLEWEGSQLETIGEKHYYDIRTRFNEKGNPLDFLFLSRACFNGLIRFNSKGKFNVPFCRKPQRFAKAYITKIVNQIKQFREVTEHFDWHFTCCDFETAIEQATENDLIYCDPPYLGRHTDYFDSWSEDDEYKLFCALSKTSARFILSTWHSNQYRENETLKKFWSTFNVITKEHFYHVGAKETNRSAMLEALVLNFPTKQIFSEKSKTPTPSLFDVFTVSEFV